MRASISSFASQRFIAVSFIAKLGLAWPETNVAHTDRPTLIRHLLEGQYSSPVCVVAFNTAEGWSLDVSEGIAATLAQACADRGEIPSSIADFIADHPSE